MIVVPEVPALILHTSDNVSFPLLFNVPTVQVPAANVVPPEGVAFTNVVPVGHESVIVNEVA